MTTYTFEMISQAEAGQLRAGDFLHFSTASPLQVDAVYAAATPASATTITMSYSGKALTFRADALGDQGDAIDFRQGGISQGSLMLLGENGDRIDAYTTTSRAIWAFGGNDHVTISGTGAVAVHAGADDDLIDVDNVQQPGGGYGPTGHYFVDGGLGNDSIALHFATGSVDVWGGAGRDVIEGGESNDHLYGNAQIAVAGSADGDDNIDGGAGHDYIQGNAGDDVLIGGPGNDRVYGGSGEDWLSGGEGHDYLQGNKGADLMSGQSGNDTLRGGADDDHMLGGEGNDLLMGDAGNDNLSGGTGVDTLIAGAGADVIRFNGSDAFFDPNDTVGVVDRIEDFAKGSDHILLGFQVAAVITDPMPITFGSLGGAATYAGQLMASHAGDHEVVAMTQHGDTLLFFASNGGSAVDSAIRLSGFAYTSADLDIFG